MQSEARAWSQRFRDPALERAFQDDVAARVQRSFRIVSTLQTGFWLALFVLDRDVAGSPANYRILLIIRFGAALVMLPILLGSGWAGAATFRRWKDVAVSMELVALLVPFVMGLVVPEPELFQVHAANAAQAAALAAIPCVCALWGLRLDVLALVVPASLAGAIGIALRYPSRYAGATLFASGAAVVSGALIAWLIDRGKREAFIAERAVARERERSDNLLRNMLPAAIADRLKASSGRIAEQLDEVTVLFADIAGFTPLSAELSATEVVDTLDEIFSEFDELAHRHGLEKIKTIGDSYMVVGGAPTPRADHAEAVAAMALEMRDLVEVKRFVGGRQLKLRIGIHTGPVVAGVIGKKKFVYDLWGDTVNTASRMESHGVAGAVQVSEATSSRLRHRFKLSPRGAIDIKGKGPMPTWFLDGPL